MAHLLRPYQDLVGGLQEPLSCLARALQFVLKYSVQGHATLLVRLQKVSDSRIKSTLLVWSRGVLLGELSPPRPTTHFVLQAKSSTSGCG